jgi:hypothetical protein
MGLEALLAQQIIGLSEAIDDEVASLLVAGTGITLTYNDGAGTLTIANTGLGGSTGATDNRILRADGTGGSTVQNSAVTIDDSGNISGLGTVDCGAITASGDILPEANETRSIGSASLRYLAGHFRQLVVTSSAVNPQIQIGASGEGYIERASSALQLGYGFSSNLSVAATFINANVPFRFPPYTVATLPNVATHTGRTVRVTDSSVTTFHSIVAGGGSDMVLVLSDGTNWRVR